MSDDEFDRGTAGASAERERSRRHDARRLAAEQRSGLARLVAAVAGPSAAERRRIAEEDAWATGARGEQIVAETLRRRCPNVEVLHDRRLPRSAANIDHLAVAASGVYVIDTKRYRGKIEVRTPLLGRRSLRIAGRDQSKLVASLTRQVDAVRAALAKDDPLVTVHGCFCFVAPEGLLAEDGLPLLRTLSINGYPLLYPRRLVKRLNASGPLGSQRAHELARALAEAFPPA